MDVAVKAARRYARKVWWVDEEELRQEATSVALHAASRWDPEPGVPLGAYVWKACVLHLRAFLWRNSAPVTETSHKLANLRGVHRAELRDTSAITDIDAFSLLSEKEWTEEVRVQLDCIFGKRGEGPLVARVLFDEEPPRRVAADAGIPVTHLYRLVRSARADIAESAYLHHMLRRKQ